MGLTDSVLDLLRICIRALKSKVQIGQHVSSFFLWNVGARQSENLSRFLFSLFINDLESFLQSNDIVNNVGFKCSKQNTQDDFYLYAKAMYTLLC